MGSEKTPTDSPGNQALKRRFTTRAQLMERQQVGKRILWAMTVSLLVVLLVIFLGPDPDPNDPLLQHYGVKNELRIMPDVSIEDGADKIHQMPKSLMAPPPPSQLEIDREDPSENATEPVPPDTDRPITEVVNEAVDPDPNAEIASNEQVQLQLPQQSNPDWYILHQVWPEYPLTASEEERRMEVIFVKAAIFVGTDGTVSDVMIQATNGSTLFTNEVLQRVKLWVFGWRVPQSVGRWITMSWNFNSPYFNSRNR